MGNELHDGLILAFVSFVAIDLFFKRSFERIAWVVDKKEDCLKGVIRPLLRVLKNVESSQMVSVEQKNEIICLYERMFPSPKEEVLKRIEELNVEQTFNSVDNVNFSFIQNEIKLQKENFRGFILSYGGMFLDLPFADGFVANMAVALHFLKYILWLPIILYVYFYKSFTFFWVGVIFLTTIFPLKSGLKSWKIRRDRMRSENLKDSL